MDDATTRLENRPRRSVDSDQRIPAEATNAPPGSYVLARVTAEVRPGTAVNVICAGAGRPFASSASIANGPSPAGRSTCHRQPVRKPAYRTRRRPQRLFDTYARDERQADENLPRGSFRALSPSEQTTFDGVTHALMSSLLTDGPGNRSAGRSTSWLVSTLAGEQAGRSGDQQFRVYVTLRPDARDILERSREFVRSEENAVYHAGYPHSYRLGSGVPSVQFSLAEDGLGADIDVDYRASKAPQSLFNGHLTSSNSDVRAGDNAQRHTRRWTGFNNWWSEVFGGVRFGDGDEKGIGPFTDTPTRPPSSLPPNRPANASIPELADAVQEFFAKFCQRNLPRPAFQQNPAEGFLHFLDLHRQGRL